MTLLDPDLNPDYDRSFYYEVLAEMWRFRCVDCNNEWNSNLYPAPCENSPAILIDCEECRSHYFWSRKLSKLFHGITEKEVPENNAVFVKKIKALQLRTLKP